MWTPQHMRKIFVGGLDPATTNESLQEHFSNFGDIIDSIVMKDPVTSRSRGFGFVTFADPGHVDAVQKGRPHKVDGKLVETKRAVPRNEGPNVNAVTSNDGGGHSRIFIGGLSQEAKEDDLEQYFKHFGDVVCVNIMYDKETGRHRGFAFVDFNDYDHVDKVLLTHSHFIKGKPIDVKKAISRSEVSKIKSSMAGASKQDASHPLGSLGGFSPVPGLIHTHSNNNQSPAAHNFNGKTAGNVMSQNSAAFAEMLQFGSLRHPFIPGIAAGGVMPNLTKQVPSGWQYSVSSNAEVLRNAGTESDGESCCSLDDNSMDVEDDSVAGPSWKDSQDTSASATVLFLEPYYGGNNKRLINILINDQYIFNPENVSLFTLSGKKKHWKARTSALYFYQKIPKSHNFKVLFTSSTLNLCELLSLRPDLSSLKKIVYFHDNQLVFPLLNSDYQFGYNQILSCLVADSILFNSEYNLESFLREIPRFLKQQPGLRPNSSKLVDSIKNKSKVLYFPVNIIHKTRSTKDALEPLHIIWPYSGDPENDPETFFRVLFQLAEAGLNFRISVIGEPSSTSPHIFEEAKQRLANFIIHWGPQVDEHRYWALLHTGDVVVSTAHHEFFGVSMLEAVGAGCIPLCPNRLVYPEIYSQDCLYNTTEQLQKTLGQWCTRPQLVRSHKVNLDLNTFSWQTLRAKYAQLFDI